MSRPRLIAIDMDGTLLDSRGRISPRAQAALHRAEAAGVEIVISTGRRYCYAMRVLRPIGLRGASAVVSSNGTVIRTVDSDLLHRVQLRPETSRWLCEYLRPFRNTLVMTFDNVAPGGADTRGSLVVEQLDALHGSISAWMRANDPWIEHVVPIERALETGAPIQMMLCGTCDRMREAETLLLQHPGVAAVGHTETEGDSSEVSLHRTEYPGIDLCLLDILPGGVSKASGLRLLAAMRGVASEEILAIGDNWNDVAMLDLAGRGVLMANAPDELRAMAAAGRWQQGASNDDDGVALAIEASL